MNTAWTITCAMKQFGRGLRQIFPRHPDPCVRERDVPVIHAPQVQTGQTARTEMPVPAQDAANRTRPLRPLRIVRVFEQGIPRAQTGRIVISGRMADVCAELERLAACEAA